MTYFNKVGIYGADTPSIDAFGRWRTSNPYTMFDSKQLWDSQPFLWSDSGSASTSTTHSINKAATTIAVSNTTSGKRIRQTFTRFNYQPGKSQEILLTYAGLQSTTGVIKRVGYFDDNNGIFLESSGSDINLVVRSNVSGSATNTRISQSDWNLDTMDGNGESTINLDFSKTQISFIDFEWLGVGRVRAGFVIDGNVIYAHDFYHANILPTVYMSTPILPLRYEISNDGTGQASSFDHICASVMSEGGREFTGVVRHKHNLNVSLNTDTHYGLIGIRLNPSRLGHAELIAISVAASTAGDLGHWMIIRNPTVAGTFNYINQANSIVQIATGSASNTITNGTHLDGGFYESTSPKTELLKSLMTLGAGIDGTPIEFVLTIIPTSNQTVSANIEWRE